MIAIMSDEIVAHLRPRAIALKTLERKEHLFHRDDRVVTMFLLTEGCVKLMRYQEDGSPAVLQRSTPGTMVAEASLFSGRYHCDAIAVTATQALAVPVGEVRRLLNEDRAFALAWTMHLTRELQNTRKRAEIVSLRTVSARLDAWLTWNDGRLPTKGDWKALADEIAVSPEALYREFSRRRHS